MHAKRVKARRNALTRFNRSGVCQFSYDGVVFCFLPGSDCEFLISISAWLYKVLKGINCLGIVNSYCPGSI